MLQKLIWITTLILINACGYPKQYEPLSENSYAFAVSDSPRYDYYFTPVLLSDELSYPWNYDSAAHIYKYSDRSEGLENDKLPEGQYTLRYESLFFPSIEFQINLSRDIVFTPPANPYGLQRAKMISYMDAWNLQKDSVILIFHYYGCFHDDRVRIALCQKDEVIEVAAYRTGKQWKYELVDTARIHPHHAYHFLNFLQDSVRNRELELIPENIMTDSGIIIKDFWGSTEHHELFILHDGSYVREFINRGYEGLQDWILNELGLRKEKFWQADQSISSLPE